MGTKIEWCQEVWNPVVGCSKCSPGCDHCYAERMAGRLAAIEISKKSGIDITRGIGRYASVINSDGKWNGITEMDRNYDPKGEALKPLRIKKSKLIFVCSMGDLFHDNVKPNTLLSICNVQASAPQHTYIWLTKRPERMRDFIVSTFGKGGPGKNVWCGVTVCNGAEAEKKISVLLKIPATVRFISIEPMLSKIDFRMWLNLYGHIGPPCCVEKEGFHRISEYNGSKNQSLIDWVIVGGESGTGARPMHPEWARLIRDQCAVAMVPFLFKQWGEWAPGECIESQRKYSTKIYDGAGGWDSCSDDWITEKDYGPIMYRAGKKNTGRLLDGNIHDEYPTQLYDSRY